MSRGKPRHADTERVESSELASSIAALRQVLTEAREVIADGRTLQRDLRVDMRSYRMLLDRRVEDLFEERVHAAVKETERILNIVQETATRDILQEFRTLRNELLSNRSPRELEFVARTMGDVFAINKGFRDGVPEIVSAVNRMEEIAAGELDHTITPEERDTMITYSYLKADHRK